MAKYEVLRDCYGFQNRYWEKGEIVEIDPEMNPPKHFKKIKAESAAVKEQKQEEPTTAAAVAREELLVEAKSHGIKDAEVLNQEELLEVLARDISQQKIRAIVAKAKKRQQK
ncbi:MAG: hypothetical protein C4540_04610 [Candidatus Omnitrophota bacterium]|jgi:hypothetical protein|nr:MAG: hypothetical protein C4540_04610 [Candidatus Omnitrophota bacterium]